MKKHSAYTLNRAKRTAFGRILRRLFGEQAGAVMMEYVVLGVLLVAAVVGAVVYFGKGITNDLEIMTDATTSPEQAVETRKTNIEDNEKNLIKVYG